MTETQQAKQWFDNDRRARQARDKKEERDKMTVEQLRVARQRDNNNWEGRAGERVSG